MTAAAPTSRGPATLYAELVCGPPGSGKTTYCEGKRQFVSAVYRNDRHIVHINLDPANDGIFPYPCHISVCDLILHADVMQQEHLGPNGSYLFCLDYIAGHPEWLRGKVAEVVAKISVEEDAKDAANRRVGRSTARKPIWLLVDCPGQVECYIHSQRFRSLIALFTKDLRCTGVAITHLCDAGVATRDVSTYISTCLLSLSTMVDLELPQCNVLSKWDVAQQLHSQRSDEASEGRGAAAGRLECFLDTPNFLDSHFDRMWNAMQPHNLARQERKAAVSRKLMRAPSEGAGVDEGEEEVTPPAAVLAGPNRLKNLARSLLEVVDGYSLVGFVPLNINDGESMRHLCDRIDTSVGWIPLC